jgi:hypothetical protein
LEDEIFADHEENERVDKLEFGDKSRKQATVMVSGRTIFGWGVLVLVVSTAAAQPDESPDGSEWVKVYLTEAEALEIAFPMADTVWSEAWTPTDAQHRSIERRLGWRVETDTFTIYQGLKDGKLTGLALIGEEIGLYRPITFLVKVGPAEKVEAVHVMIYRESRGGEVRRQRFLSQYGGKTIGDPIRINRDIIGVTGATLSVRAMNAGVKKALAVVEAYGKAQEKEAAH